MISDQIYKKVDILNDNEEIILTSSKIRAEDDRIILHGQDFALIDRTSKVLVKGYLEDGMVLMDGQISLSTTSQINIDILKYYEKIDRRDFLKVITNINADIIRAFSLGNSNKSFIVNERVRIRDLSIGGVCFFSNRTFLINQRLDIDLSAIHSNLILKVVILRKEHKSGIGKYRYRYACKFLHLSNEEDRAICEYVFRVQLGLSGGRGY